MSNELLGLNPDPTPEQIEEAKKRLLISGEPISIEVTEATKGLALTGRDRMTVVMQIGHEQHRKQPVGRKYGQSRMLQTREQSFYREYKIGRVKKVLNCGPVEAPGCIAIENITGMFLDMYPTPEQKSIIDDSLLIINDLFVVRPGGIPFFAEILPGAEQQIIIVGTQEVVDFTVFVIPR